MQFSLVTTLYNECDNILNFLDSYRNQTKYADEFIIVDGGSTDGTIDIINNFSMENTYLNIRLIVDKSCSKKFIAGPVAKGRNIAIENSSYDYIVATDAGCILDKNWFEEIIKPFEDVSVDVVSGWYESLITNEFQKIYDEILMPKLESLNRETFLPSSRSIAFKKECWEQVGGYPTQTLTAEDTKFDIDLKKAGYKFSFTEKAFVYWECPKSLEEAKQKHYNYSYGDGQLRMRIISNILKIPFMFLPLHILLSKKKRKYFKTSYIIFIYSKIGYFKGLFEGLEK